MVKPIYAEKHYKLELGDLVWDFDGDKVSRCTTSDLQKSNFMVGIWKSRTTN